MRMRQEFGTPDDLTYLRSESLQPVLFCVMGVLYLWYVILFHPINRVGGAGLGPLLLAVGLAAAFFTRKYNASLASAALILGIAAASLNQMWRGDPAAPYLLAVVVSLTGLLFNLKTVVGVTILCSSAVIGIGWLHWGHSPFSNELFSSVLVIVLVGIMSSLTVRNLYLTLYWAWDRAKAAQSHEEELLDRQGELARALKALDVSYQQLERLNYDLARAREAAEEARQAKQQFATNISHELRTPLNVIMAFSEMMYLSPGSYNNVPLPPAYRGDIREIYRSCKHLLQLTEDVLNLSKIEASQMKIHPEPTKLPELVAEALGIIRPLLRDKPVELKADLPKNLPLLTIDRTRVRQVLLNLLNNARRFTEQGSITVQAVLENKHIKITVADTGKGIPADKLQTVFKEFEQLDDSVSLQHLEGSGLGLVISQRFVEMHGGRIWAESAGIPGQGSRFHFILPLKESTFITSGREERHRLPVRTPTGRGRSVLLLDSDPAIKRLVEDALETYQVLAVADNSDLPGLLAETHPQAVIFNLMQPEQTWQQLRAWKEKTDRLAIPMIFCPFIGPQQWRQALNVIEYLVKPITREALTALLNRLDPHPRRILLIDDDPRMSHLLTRLLEAEGADYQISRANNGRVGLEMMQQHPPDLVLMDLSMPEMSGHTLLAQIKQDPALCAIPIAVITAYISTPEEERSLGGKSLFISHPIGFTNEEVLSYVRSLLDGTSVSGGLHLAQHLGQGSQQVGLPDGFAQVSSCAQ